MVNLIGKKSKNEYDVGTIIKNEEMEWNMNKNKTDFDELWNEVLPIPEDLGFRSWGKETLLAVSSKKIMLKKLEIKAGSKGGLQYHRKRVEAGYIVSGS